MSKKKIIVAMVAGVMLAGCKSPSAPVVADAPTVDSRAQARQLDDLDKRLWAMQIQLSRMANELDGLRAKAAGMRTDQPTAATEIAEGYSYYDLEPFTTNLNEPRLARYVRATITLAFEPKQESEVTAQVRKRMPEVKNWLAVYLAGRTLEQVRGAEALNRLRQDICETLNKQIWPEQPPRIHHVLLREWAVQ